MGRLLLLGHHGCLKMPASRGQAGKARNAEVSRVSASPPSGGMQRNGGFSPAVRTISPPSFINTYSARHF